MLSAAKHLQYLLENKQMQILRFAQDDAGIDFFRILLGNELRVSSFEFREREVLMQVMNRGQCNSIRNIALTVTLGALFVAMVVPAQEAGTPSRSDVLRAVGSRRSINTAEAYYAKQYGKGFSPTLAALGVPPAGAKPSAEAAGLLVNALTAGTFNNHTFKYGAGIPGANGKISVYTVSAQPAKWTAGAKSFFTDQTGMIRWTDENRPPRASDAPIK